MSKEKKPMSEKTKKTIIAIAKVIICLLQFLISKLGEDEEQNFPSDIAANIITGINDEINKTTI